MTVYFFPAVGCAEVTQPEGGWTKRERDRLTAGCYHVQRTWHLTCNGSSWIGEIGNCATGSSNLRTGGASIDAVTIGHGRQRPHLNKGLEPVQGPSKKICQISRFMKQYKNYAIFTQMCLNSTACDITHTRF